MSSLERYHSEHRDELVRSTLDLVGIDTSNPPGETTVLADLIEERFATLDLETRRVTVDPAKPNVLATIPGEREHTLCFNGHLDTVPFDEREWTYDPLGERVDDRIYGRGATDMKGPLAAMVHAATSIVETDVTPPVTVSFAFVSDEEVGGAAGLPAVIEEGGFEPDASLIGETTCEGERHSVAVADRGSIWLTLEATGQAAHGSRPMLGVNAIDRLYGAISSIREVVGGQQIEVPSAVAPIVEESVQYYGPLLGTDEARRLFTRPTINLGTMQGGEAINAVPARATARLDIRIPPGVEPGPILEAVRSCVAGCEGITIADVSWASGTFDAIDDPLVSAVTSVGRELTGKRLFRRSATGGGDAKRVRNIGVPTVEFALGTDTAHAVDEYTTLQALEKNALGYTRLPWVYAEHAGLIST